MKILRINMTDLSVLEEVVPQDYVGLGGRALTSMIVANEVRPTCHPLGPNNKLVFAPGLLTGTMAPNTGRLSVGAKSPLTGTIKESNAGGTSSQKLAKLGIKALVIEGKPTGEKFYTIKIDKNGASVVEENEVVGLGNYTAFKKLSSMYGEKVGVIGIGQAGEAKMSAANISVKDLDGNIRSAGRGGLGAVMGSKQVKAIVIDDRDAEGLAIAQPEKFKEAARRLANNIKKHPVTGEGIPTYGTNVMVNIINEAGGLPTRNFRTGRFDGAQKICGETMYDTIVKRNGKPTHGCCTGCIIKCSQVYNDAEGNYVTSGFEYETIWGFGANCCIDNLDDIARIDWLCDDIGIDTIEMAATTAVAMDAGIINFGDGKAVIRLLEEEVAKASPLGRILGNGADLTGKAYGITRVPTVKGQSIPAYDPRAIKGMGITYATSTQGADHTAGYTVGTNLLKIGGEVNPLGKAGQVELSRNLQIATAALDSTGLCLFVAFPILDFPDTFQAIVDLINAQYNLELTCDNVNELGKLIIKTEKEFNKAAGFSNAHDRLPEFLSEECAPHNTTWDFTGAEIDELYNF
ncbi:aldehyde ferredoxin oxidoreductase family protein [Desulfoscipio gibsoniae]|uniref:Aldehyde:ferredoxin oxidoreductase n=1 Tax=Desulfoscipio gibsoniae DSM 7213 TaxID=767817 RepID=R4KP07_9FIRM|nr:aldehyde ferredoxin oxidoreductase C-terminal domain-containing protein [Desulfoscipio gibsoniae]AGL02300.1 aldehyde:ferredoxin oxidoreductase [Desulfoscipio gibsoniae DSM 7213]